MSFFKTLLAFIICTIILFLFNAYIAIPILPCITMYIFSSLVLDKFSVKNFTVYNTFLIILGIVAIGLYSFQVFTMFHFYPKYGNWLGIIFEILTILSFLTATILHYLNKQTREKLIQD